MRRTLLLDLDGTLVDSVPDLTSSLNRLAATRGAAPFAPAEVRDMVGDGAGALVRKALDRRGVADDGTALPWLMADYGAHLAEQTRPFPGVPETLRDLARDGWILAVCTNKPERLARALLEALGLAPLFTAITGPESAPARKPDPSHVLAALAQAGGGASVMVGDHHNDIVAAHGAGLPVIFAAWGFGDDPAGADAVADRFADVPAIAAGLLARRQVDHRLADEARAEGDTDR